MGKNAIVGKRVTELLVVLLRLLTMPGLWATFILFAMLVRATAEYMRDLHPVTLVVDGQTRAFYTRQATVRGLLADVGVTLSEHDRVIPALDTPLRSGMTITVERARPVVVMADGVERVVYAHEGTVDDILRLAKVELRPGDSLAVDGQVRVAGRTSSARGGRAREPQPLPARIEVKRAKVMYLDDSGVEQPLRTTAHTVGQALYQAGVTVYYGDRVYPDLNATVAPGLRVHIQRGLPIATTVDGHTIRARTHSKTVGEVLAELGVSLVGRDISFPPPEAAVEEGMQIRVVRVVEKTFVEEEIIPFETEWIPDPSLEIDHRRVDDAGSNGIIRHRYKAVYHDGKEVSRYLEDEWVARTPHPREIAYGTRIVIRTLETPDGPIEYWRRIRVFLTSYTEATCGKTPDHPLYGITRLGWKMRHGIIAVDPRVIPLRTKLYVPGYGPGIAGDTGGLIKGRHIDLGYDVDNFVMHYEWGYVYLLTPVPPPSKIRWILPDFPRER